MCVIVVVDKKEKDSKLTFATRNDPIVTRKTLSHSGQIRLWQAPEAAQSNNHQHMQRNFRHCDSLPITWTLSSISLNVLYIVVATVYHLDQCH